MKKVVIYGAVGVTAFLLYKHLQNEKAKKLAADAAAAASTLKNDVIAMLPGMGDDDDHLLLPPPGRTLSASGQVLGGLGENFDVYDAAPYQYRSDVINDMQGLGRFSLKKAVKSVAKAVTKTVASIPKVLDTPVFKAVALVNPAALAARVAQSTAKIATRTISNPTSGWKTLTGALKSFTIKPLMQAGMVVGIVKPPKQVPSGSDVVYQDANGNPISKEEYDKLAAAAAASLPSKALDYKGYSIWTYNKPEGGALYLINYDDVANSCEGAYDTMEEAKAAIDAVSVPAGVPEVTPASVAHRTADPKSVVSFAQTYGGHAISTLIQPGGGVVYLIDVPAGSDGNGLVTFPTMAAAQAYIDATNPRPSPPVYQPQPAAPVYQPQEAPALPVDVTSVQTPSAQVYTPSMQTAAPAPKKSNAGLVVGGGLLAATAGLLFMNR